MMKQIRDELLGDDHTPLPRPTEMTPLAEARLSHFRRVKDSSDPIPCPCCEQATYVYPRKIYATMARAIIYAWPLFKQYPGRFLKIFSYTNKKYGLVSWDHPKLVHWGILEQADSPRKDGSKRNGMWRLTPLGVLFVQGKVKVREIARLYNAELLEYAGGEVDIHDALGKKFSYSELMGRVEKDEPQPPKDLFGN